MKLKKLITFFIPKLFICLIILDMVLYYPFFKMYDKELLEEEKAKEAIEG